MWLGALAAIATIIGVGVQIADRPHNRPSPPPSTSLPEPSPTETSVTSTSPRAPSTSRPRTTPTSVKPTSYLRRDSAYIPRPSMSGYDPDDQERWYFLDVESGKVSKTPEAGVDIAFLYRASSLSGHHDLFPGNNVELAYVGSSRVDRDVCSDLVGDVSYYQGERLQVGAQFCLHIGAENHYALLRIEQLPPNDGLDSYLQVAWTVWKP